MGLHHERILFAGDVVQGPIQPSLDFLVVRSFPGNFLDSGESQRSNLLIAVFQNCLQLALLREKMPHWRSRYSKEK